MKIRTPLLAAALLATSIALPAAAQTVYKLIDKNGRVTYSESPPKDFDGRVIRVDVDPKANTATLPKPQPPAVRAADKGASANGAEAARQKLESAQRALQDAIDNPREGEVTRVGNKGNSFTRPVPTEEYQKRLDALRENVRKAEEELRVAEGR